MKNKEKYIDELMEILFTKDLLAVNKETNRPVRCKSFKCSYCLFDNNCQGSESRKNWLNAEYKEPIYLTNDEIVILKNIDKEYKWIARDENGMLCVFSDEPYKNEELKEWFYRHYSSLCSLMHLFQFVKWEDEVPYEIDKLLKDNGVER